MPSSCLILCHPLLLQPPVPPSIRVFSNESTLRMRWPKYWSFSFSCFSFIKVRQREKARIKKPKRNTHFSHRPHAFVFCDHKVSKTFSGLRLSLELLFYYLFQYFQKTKISHCLFSFIQGKGNLRESIQYLHTQIFIFIYLGLRQVILFSLVS